MGENLLRLSFSCQYLIVLGGPQSSRLSMTKDLVFGLFWPSREREVLSSRWRPFAMMVCTQSPDHRCCRAPVCGISRFFDRRFVVAGQRTVVSLLRLPVRWTLCAKAVLAGRSAESRRLKSSRSWLSFALFGREVCDVWWEGVVLHSYKCLRSSRRVQWLKMSYICE